MWGIRTIGCNRTISHPCYDFISCSPVHILIIFYQIFRCSFRRSCEWKWDLLHRQHILHRFGRDPPVRRLLYCYCTVILILISVPFPDHFWRPDPVCRTTKIQRPRVLAGIDEQCTISCPGEEYLRPVRSIMIIKCRQEMNRCLNAIELV